MKRTVFTIAAIALAGSAFAHGKATGIVRERMDAMVVLADTMKFLAGMAKSDTPLDPSKLQAASNAIAAHAGTNLTAQFPAGSTAHSDATDQVWSDPDGFQALAEGLLTLSADLPTLTDKSALSIKIRELGATCKDCHAVYRRKSE